MASKNIVLKGTTYNGVESITLPTSPSGDATFVEVSDTTATASDVLNSKYFYTAAGVKTQGTGTGGSATLITKNITANGTYNASSDNADGYSSVTVSVSGGGDSWSWMGKNPTKVKTSLDEKKYLKDTDFATWTPTTTQTTLAAGTTLDAYTADFDSYDYIVLHRFHTHFEYSTSVNPHVDNYYFEAAYNAIGYASNYSNMTADTINIVTGAATITGYGLDYKNSSGANSYASQTYGVYVSGLTTPGTSTTSITPKTSAVYARCGNSYFSTAAAEAVNQNTSYYEQAIEIWKVDRGTSLNGALRKDVDDRWLADR